MTEKMKDNKNVKIVDDSLDRAHEIVIGYDSTGNPITEMIKPLDIKIISKIKPNFCIIKLFNNEEIFCSVSAYDLIYKIQVCMKVRMILENILYQSSHGYINVYTIIMNSNIKLCNKQLRSNLKDLTGTEVSYHYSKDIQSWIITKFTFFITMNSHYEDHESTDEQDDD
ncbi:MAG: hypothetical protein ACRC6R_02130 [Bacteroidales bacterium]